MSCDIREYESIYFVVGDGYNQGMKLTAFVGGKNNGHSVQFTIGNNYCALGQKEIIDLIETLKKRLNCDEGYTATGHERNDIKYQK